MTEVVPVPSPGVQTPVDVIEGGTEKIVVVTDPDAGLPVFAFRSTEDIPADLPRPALVAISPTAPI